MKFLKPHTRKLANAFKARRGAMDTPHRRLLGWLEAWLMDHAFIRAVYCNIHKVSDRMYRSAQPAPGHVAAWAAKGVRTIVNLRGERDCAAYLLEKEACAAHGITLVDFPLGSREAPSKQRLHGLKELFARIDYPALMHCKSGADRAGLGAVLYLHLHEGVPLPEAMGQLSWRYGHIKQARTGVLDYLCERYIAETEASGKPFLQWVDEDYDPAELAASFRSSGRTSAVGNTVVDKVLGRE